MGIVGGGGRKRQEDGGRGLLASTRLLTSSFEILHIK